MFAILVWNHHLKENDTKLDILDKFDFKKLVLLMIAN